MYWGKFEYRAEKCFDAVAQGVLPLGGPSGVFGFDGQQKAATLLKLCNVFPSSRRSYRVAL